MQKKIYYIGYLDAPGSRAHHFASPAATAKIKYVVNVISKCGYDVQIISPAQALKTQQLFCKAEDVALDEHIDVHYFSSFCFENVRVRHFSALWQLLCLAVYLFCKLKRDDVVVLYHNLSYLGLIRVLKRLLGFKLILEVEEIYGDVKTVRKSVSKMEKSFFTLADAFIFPSEMLDKMINRKSLESIIIYGNYLVPDRCREKLLDGKTHILYSGTFDSRKGGAITAIKAGEFLDSNYHIHITGIGKAEETAEVQSLISSTKKKTNCLITFDGFIEDAEFLPYIQQFNIGLCTQNPDDKLSLSCFPSKILLYMSNGLAVLSSCAPAVVNSVIAGNLFFYECQDPQLIADKIKKIPQNNDVRGVVRSLDKECRVRMAELLQRMMAN